MTREKALAVDKLLIRIETLESAIDNFESSSILDNLDLDEDIYSALLKVLTDKLALANKDLEELQ